MKPKFDFAKQKEEIAVRKCSEQVRRWKNKKTKEIIKATPWWEMVDPIISDNDAPNYVPGDHKWKIGALIQVGWLLKNKHDVWFGIPGGEIEKQFKDLGKWKEPASKVKKAKKK